MFHGWLNVSILHWYLTNYASYSCVLYTDRKLFWQRFCSHLLQIHKAMVERLQVKQWIFALIDATLVWNLTLKIHCRLPMFLEYWNNYKSYKFVRYVPLERYVYCVSACVCCIKINPCRNGGEVKTIKLVWEIHQHFDVITRAFCEHYLLCSDHCEDNI